VSESTHNAIVKLLAILLCFWGLSQLLNGLDHGGAFARIGMVLWGALVFVTGIGFFRMRGWAFLLVSVGLLGSFFVNLIGFILAVDQGAGVKGHLFHFILTLVLIAYLGRWSMERRFRPHLEHQGH
jgi:hypothetical protein